MSSSAADRNKFFKSALLVSESSDSLEGLDKVYFGDFKDSQEKDVKILDAGLLKKQNSLKTHLLNNQSNQSFQKAFSNQAATNKMPSDSVMNPKDDPISILSRTKNAVPGSSRRNS